jgi:hypothetical protein
MHLRCRPHFSEPHGCAFRVLVRVLTEGAVSNDWSKTRPKTGLALSKDALSECLHFCITPVSEGAFTATILFTAQNDVLRDICSDPLKTPPDYRFSFGQSQPCQMTSRPIKKGSSALHVTRRRGLTDIP